MAKDIMPGSQGDLTQWLTTFKTEVGAHGATLGLSPGEITQAQNLCDQYIAQIKKAAIAKAESISANTAKQAMRKTHLQPIRKLIRRMKTNPAYSANSPIKGIITAHRSDFIADEYKPQLTATHSGRLIALRFKRKAVERLEFYGQRNGTGDWIYLGSRSRSPFYFRPPHYVTGTMEKWLIKAVGVVKDKPVGKESDMVPVVYLDEATDRDF